MKPMNIARVAALIAAIGLSGQVANAQQHHGAQSPGQGPAMQQGPGMMGGRGMMGQMMQGGGMGRGCPMMGMMMGATQNTFAAGRIAFLKAELGIKDSQQGAFDAYAEVLKNNLNNMQTMRQSMMGAMSAKTPVERLDAHLKMMEERTTSLKAIKPKLEALYAVLSDEQKKTADQLLTGMGCMM